MKIRTLAVPMAALAAIAALAGCAPEAADAEAAEGAGTTSAEQTGTGEAGPVTLYIVRHGKTMLNTTDRVQGWSDAVLTPEGEEVVASAAEGLADVEFEAAYSSDSGRAVQTADFILEANTASGELELQRDSRLREFNFGTYEGDLNETMWTDIAESQGLTLEEFMEQMTPEGFANSVAALDAADPEAEGNWPAEDYETITARLTEAVNEIAENEAEDGGGNVLIVSHGLSITALVDVLVPDFEIPPGGVTNASATIITYEDGEFAMQAFNDMSHVEE
jgi:probable phosphoglycerate mutase